MNTCQILFKSLIEEKQGEMVQSVQKKKEHKHVFVGDVERNVQVDTELVFPREGCRV